MDIWSSLSIHIAASLSGCAKPYLGLTSQESSDMILILVYLFVSCACLLCIYIDHCIFADVDIVTSCNKCLNDYQTSLGRLAKKNFTRSHFPFPLQKQINIFYQWSLFVQNQSGSNNYSATPSQQFLKLHIYPINFRPSVKHVLGSQNDSTC